LSKLNNTLMRPASGAREATALQRAASKPPGSGDTAAANAAHGHSVKQRNTEGNRLREAQAQPTLRDEDVDAGSRGTGEEKENEDHDSGK
jgi:hypothetical protein